MKKRQLEPIWTKSFISISMTQFLLFTVFYALLTTLPIYVINDLEGTQSSAGLVVTFMLVAAIIVRPFTAKILDIFGKKRSLVVSVIVFTITAFFYIWVEELTALLTLRFIHGVSFGVLTTATGAIAADTIPHSRRGAGMGYFAMAMNLAVVIGPFIGLTLLQFIPFRILFIVLSGLMILGAFSAMGVRTIEHPHGADGNPFKLKLSDLLEVKALPVALISGLIGFAYASVLSFVSVYADELGLSSAASYFFLVFAIVMIVFRPYLGRALDEKGAKKVLIPCIFIFAVGLSILGFTTTSIMLLLAAGLIGLGYGTLLPGFQTLSIQSASEHRSGHAISTFFIFYDLGIAAGAFVWGLIVAQVGFGKMYILSAILVLVTVFIFHAFLVKREKRSSSKQSAIGWNVSESK